CEQRLDSMEIADCIVGIGLRLCERGGRLRDGSLADLDLIVGSGLVGNCVLLAGTRYIDRALLRSDSAALILDLSLKTLLGRQCVLQCIKIGTVIDLIKETSLPDEFVIANGKFYDGTCDNRRHANKVSDDLRIIGAGIVGHPNENSNQRDKGTKYDDATDQVSAQRVLR